MEGDRREFTVWLGDRCIAKRFWIWFPAESRIVSKLRKALER